MGIAAAAAGAAVALAGWQVWLHFSRVRAPHARDDLQEREEPFASVRAEHAPYRPEAGAPRAARSRDPAVAPLVEQATAVARRLVERYPADAEAVATAAQVHRELGDADLAVAAWQRCLTLDAEFVDAYLGIGSVLVEQGEYAKAEAPLRKAVALAPDSPQAAVMLATALMNQGKLRETVALLEGPAQDANAPMPCLLLLGQAYLQLKDYAKAKPCFEAAVRKAPEFANAHYGLAMACTRLGQQQEAREHMKRFQEAESLRLSRQIEDLKRRDDAASVRKAAAEACASAAAISAAHGDAAEAERYRREAARLEEN